MAVKPGDVARRLRELIAALDRRVPRLERAGEASIAEDAASLRARAVKRLEEIDDRSNPVTDVPPDRIDPSGLRGR
jgi:hypothetical protein